MENITVNVFDDVLYLAWEFVYLIFFTRFVCVHGNYKNACAILDFCRFDLTDWEINF